MQLHVTALPLLFSSPPTCVKRAAASSCGRDVYQPTESTNRQRLHEFHYNRSGESDRWSSPPSPSRRCRARYCPGQGRYLHTSGPQRRRRNPLAFIPECQQPRCPRCEIWRCRKRAVCPLLDADHWCMFFVFFKQAQKSLQRKHLLTSLQCRGRLDQRCSEL